MPVSSASNLHMNKSIGVLTQGKYNLFQKKAWYPKMLIIFKNFFQSCMNTT